MKKLFAFADEYIASLKWNHLSMIKFCLISLGVIIGILVPSKAKLQVHIFPLWFVLLRRGAIINNT